MSITRYPLQWPFGWKRTEPSDLKNGRFTQKKEVWSEWSKSYQKQTKTLSISGALDRISTEMHAMGVSHEDWLISSNLDVRLDGLPRSNQRAPTDSGVAVYWRSDGQDRVMAIDQYDTVEANLAAIAATLSAMRAIERHGGASILNRAFQGFDALPAPNKLADWWEVIGVDKNADKDTVKSAYQRKASFAHPDKGGSDDAMAALNKAYAEFKNQYGDK